MGENVALRTARSVGVLGPEVQLGVGMYLLSGQAIPPGSLGVVLRNSLAEGEHDPEVVLGGGTSLLSGLSETT